jgi:hypothetical protein
VLLGHPDVDAFRALSVRRDERGLAALDGFTDARLD